MLAGNLLKVIIWKTKREMRIINRMHLEGPGREDRSAKLLLFDLFNNASQLQNLDYRP
jgi:hypothetical protein